MAKRIAQITSIGVDRQNKIAGITAQTESSHK